ncbi:hypothetical protein DIPPA_04322 [Diplonema papillatum]|nr:hypothetical protein DIPPA_04322 [Diplonema papillatum]
MVQYGGGGGSVGRADGRMSSPLHGMRRAASVGIAHSLRRRDLLKRERNELPKPRFAEEHYDFVEIEKRRNEVLESEIERARQETEDAVRDMQTISEEKESLTEELKVKDEEMSSLKKEVAEKQKEVREQILQFKTRHMYLSDELSERRQQEHNMKRQVSYMRRKVDEVREDVAWETEKAIKALQTASKKEVDINQELEMLPHKVEEAMKRKLAEEMGNRGEGADQTRILQDVLESEELRSMMNGLVGRLQEAWERQTEELLNRTREQHDARPRLSIASVASVGSDDVASERGDGDSTSKTSNSSFLDFRTADYLENRVEHETHRMVRSMSPAFQKLKQVIEAVVAGTCSIAAAVFLPEPKLRMICPRDPAFDYAALACAVPAAPPQTLAVSLCVGEGDNQTVTAATVHLIKAEHGTATYEADIELADDGIVVISRPNTPRRPSGKPASLSEASLAAHRRASGGSYQHPHPQSKRQPRGESLGGCSGRHSIRSREVDRVFREGGVGGTPMALHHTVPRECRVSPQRGEWPRGRGGSADHPRPRAGDLPVHERMRRHEERSEAYRAAAKRKLREKKLEEARRREVLEEARRRSEAQDIIRHRWAPKTVERPPASGVREKGKLTRIVTAAVQSSGIVKMRPHLQLRQAFSDRLTRDAANWTDGGADRRDDRTGSKASASPQTRTSSPSAAPHLPRDLPEGDLPSVPVRSSSVASYPSHRSRSIPYDEHAAAASDSANARAQSPPAPSPSSAGRPAHTTDQAALSEKLRQYSLAVAKGLGIVAPGTAFAVAEQHGGEGHAYHAATVAQLRQQQQQQQKVQQQHNTNNDPQQAQHGYQYQQHRHQLQEQQQHFEQYQQPQQQQQLQQQHQEEQQRQQQQHQEQQEQQQQQQHQHYQYHLLQQQQQDQEQYQHQHQQHHQQLQQQQQQQQHQEHQQQQHQQHHQQLQQQQHQEQQQQHEQHQQQQHQEQQQQQQHQHQPAHYQHQLQSNQQQQQQQRQQVHHPPPGATTFSLHSYPVGPRPAPQRPKPVVAGRPLLPAARTIQAHTFALHSPVQSHATASSPEATHQGQPPHSQYGSPLQRYQFPAAANSLPHHHYPPAPPASTSGAPSPVSAGSPKRFSFPFPPNASGGGDAMPSGGTTSPPPTHAYPGSECGGSSVPSRTDSFHRQRSMSLEALKSSLPALTHAQAALLENALDDQLRRVEELQQLRERQDDKYEESLRRQKHQAHLQSLRGGDGTSPTQPFPTLPQAPRHDRGAAPAFYRTDTYSTGCATSVTPSQVAVHKSASMQSLMGRHQRNPPAEDLSNMQSNLRKTGSFPSTVNPNRMNVSFSNMQGGAAANPTLSPADQNFGNFTCSNTNMEISHTIPFPTQSSANTYANYAPAAGGAGHSPANTVTSGAVQTWGGGPSSMSDDDANEHGEYQKTSPAQRAGPPAFPQAAQQQGSPVSSEAYTLDGTAREAAFAQHQQQQLHELQRLRNELDGEELGLERNSSLPLARQRSREIPPFPGGGGGGGDGRAAETEPFVVRRLASDDSGDAHTAPLCDAPVFNQTLESIANASVSTLQRSNQEAKQLVLSHIQLCQSVITAAQSPPPADPPGKSPTASEPAYPTAASSRNADMPPIPPRDVKLRDPSTSGVSHAASPSNKSRSIVALDDLNPPRELGRATFVDETWTSPFDSPSPSPKAAGRALPVITAEPPDAPPAEVVALPPPRPSLLQSSSTPTPSKPNPPSSPGTPQLDFNDTPLSKPEVLFDTHTSDKGFGYTITLERSVDVRPEESALHNTVQRIADQSELTAGADEGDPPATDRLDASNSYNANPSSSSKGGSDVARESTTGTEDTVAQSTHSDADAPTVIRSDSADLMSEERVLREMLAENQELAEHYNRLPPAEKIKVKHQLRSGLMRGSLMEFGPEDDSEERSAGKQVVDAWAHSSNARRLRAKSMGLAATPMF